MTSDPARLTPAQRAVRARADQLRAAEAAGRRRRRLVVAGGGVAAVVAAVLVVVRVTAGGGSLQETVPPGVGAGRADVQPAALVVPNPTSIRGVVAYDTAGWPTASHNGPAARALHHAHVTGPVTYAEAPPVGGDHNPVWMTCGTYAAPVPNERAVHNLEHGAVWITYRPGLAGSEVAALRAFAAGQSDVVETSAATGRIDQHSTYVDLSPYPGLSSPIVLTAWGYQLAVDSPTDPRMQAFVTTFRASPAYTPEYGGACGGGLGTPLH